MPAPARASMRITAGGAPASPIGGRRRLRRHWLAASRADSCSLRAGSTSGVASGGRDA